jgi:pyruvate/2-oxoglutarate dehydrogenase complex dihydrolipoamide acyltransferase (E2) component
LRKPGETFEGGEVAARLDTGKGLKDVAAVTGGVVNRLVVQIGEKAPADAVLATIETSRRTLR